MSDEQQGDRASAEAGRQQRPDPLSDPLTDPLPDSTDAPRTEQRHDPAGATGLTAPADARPAADATEVIRHDETAEVGTELQEVGSVHVRKHVEHYPVEQIVSRGVEHADASERVPAAEGDSGEVETLEDGSISIPVFEEVLVVTKKLVVRERVIVRKSTVVDEHTLRTELRREHVTVDADPEVDLEVRDGGSTAP